ncbi:SDR family oxidoreductase [Salinibacterium sp. ZJ70]|uniref:SDR family NAD(P)-dependent oxidoreductase n=1 Tax=Salinibacterium sp. ZJ70 TaxID=2708084 RepID=UPI00141FCDCC|nr:SDR family NAD(P)-dependent oxidoreductase [Salinibacterium sp. ZJ70]
MSTGPMRALVTGASSGIGRAIAREFAERGYALVLVARGADSLGELRDELTGISSASHEVLAADLGAREGVAAVSARLQATDEPVDVLVHSAGIGLPPGGYLGNPVDASVAVNRVSIDALTELAHAALPGMLDRDRGGLLTVASIAGFLPGTAAITYSASKAWAQTFGEGLNQLLRRTGVTSTVVAPGFVRSGFHGRAGLGASGIHNMMWCAPEQVASAAVRAFEKRRALVVPGGIWKAVYAAYRILPRSATRALFASYMTWTARRGS